MFVNLHYYSKLQTILTDLMCSIYDIEISQFPQSLLEISCFQILKEKFFFLFCNVGSIPLDPSVTQFLEDSRAFIDLFSDSPTLRVHFLKKIQDKILKSERIRKWILRFFYY